MWKQKSVWSTSPSNLWTSSPTLLRLMKRKQKREIVPWSRPSGGITGDLGWANLSAYAEDPGCEAGDECVGRTLRSSAVKPACRQAGTERRRVFPASADSAEGFKVPRVLTRGAPCRMCPDINYANWC